jgi:membrane protein
MPTLGLKLRRSLTRVFPGCVMLAQAVAFNMFLAFFPMLLFAIGIINAAGWVQGAGKELPQRMSAILPPGSERIVFEYLIRRSVHSARLIFLGFGGTLLAGTQVILGLMDGFRIIAGDPNRPRFWSRQLRALFLIFLTVVPGVAAVTVTVFGRQLRTWMVAAFGLPQLMRILAFIIFVIVEMLLALGVLAIVYYVGRPGRAATQHFLPGVMVATVLWWTVDVSFGWYVRHMPYDVVYGSLAAAIGLLLWMYMTALVVFVGAAYNVESERGGFRRA